MRKTPTILAVLFILITLTRVGQFSAERMQAGLLGWLFSIGLGAGVFFTAYWTREHVTVKQAGDGEQKRDRRSILVQRWAWAGLIFFSLVDGLFNMAEVWLAVNPVTALVGVATGIYGIFPTVAAGLLGVLQGFIDRLPKPPVNERVSVSFALRRWMVARVASVAQPALPPVSEVAHTKLQEKPVSTRERVRVALESQPEATITQIGHDLGITRQAVSKHVAALEKEGFVFHKNGAAK